MAQTASPSDSLLVDSIGGGGNESVIAGVHGQHRQLNMTSEISIFLHVRSTLWRWHVIRIRIHYIQHGICINTQLSQVALCSVTQSVHPANITGDCTSCSCLKFSKSLS